MATKKTSGGNRKRSTSSTTKRGTTQASMRNVTRNVPLRQPNKSDSMGYKLFYGLVTLLIVGCVFAWQNGYLDRFLVGTPLEQYATGTSTTGSGNSSVASGVSPDYADIDTTWDEAKAPNYFLVIGEAHTDHEDELKWGEIVYTGLDDLGRTREAYGKLTADMYFDSKGWRADWEAGTDRVSGWGHNRKIDYTDSNGKTTSFYWANRSHLIADSCGGASNRTNIVVGTKTQNTGEDSLGGACHTEVLARDWFEKHEGDKENYIYYCAYPIYQGDELVPRAVVYDIKTSTGDISERVITYNTIKGYRLDYATGELFDE